MRYCIITFLLSIILCVTPAYSEVPSVPGEITTFLTSPDRQRVVLEVTSRKGESWQYSLVLYNVVTEKIIASFDAEFYRPGPWSPDSRFVAINAEDGMLLIVNRDGEVRKIKLRRDCGDLLWNPQQRDHILYKGPFDSDFVTDLSLRDGTEKVILSRPHIVSIYEAGKKMYFVECVDSPDSNHWISLQAFEIGTGRLVFELPLYNHGFDVYYLQLSPTGAHFFFNGTLSSGTLNVVGRRDDAPIIFRRYYRAVLFQRAIEDSYQILWPQQIKSPDNEAIVQPHDEPSYFLDLESGSRRKVTEEPYSLSDGWLFISPEGLKRIKYTGETILLIKHTSVPQQDPGAR